MCPGLYVKTKAQGMRLVRAVRTVSGALQNTKAPGAGLLRAFGHGGCCTCIGRAGNNYQNFNMQRILNFASNIRDRGWRWCCACEVLAERGGGGGRGGDYIFLTF